MGVTEELADFLVAGNIANVSHEAMSAAKDLIISCVGAAVGGVKSPTGGLINAYIRDMKCAGEATVIGSGYQTLLPNALYANANLAHALELEDVATRGACNPLITIIASLTLGEKLGVSGRDVLESFVLGYQIEGAIYSGVRGIDSRDWNVAAVTGALGAAAAASKLLRLDVPATQRAVGVAVSETVGGRNINTGTMAHTHEQALSCRAGVEAAVLASRGFTAPLDSIENPRGYCHAFAGENGYDLAKVTETLREPRWMVEGVFIKKYPCCFRTHRAIDATLALMKDHDVSYEDITQVEVGINSWVSRLLRYSNPKTALEAGFSLEHVVAATILDERVTLQSLTHESVESPRFADARKKVSVVVHPEWSPGRIESLEPVTMRLRDGRTLRKQLNDPIQPTRHQLISKYRMCAENVLSEQQIELSLELLTNLENVENISALMNVIRK